MVELLLKKSRREGTPFVQPSSECRFIVTLAAEN